MDGQETLLDGPLESLTLYGLPVNLRDSPVAYAAYESKLPSAPPCGLLGNSGLDQLPLSTMQVPDGRRLIYDSAKLAHLDTLLQELKAGDHRVLIYFQMTRMMDLMEEYLIYRQHKYIRLDGSSKLEDRRDMVMDWQTRFVLLCPRWFEQSLTWSQARHLHLLAQYPCGWSWYKPDCRGHRHFL